MPLRMHMTTNFTSSMAAWSIVVCSLCGSCSPLLPGWLSHLQHVHRSDSYVCLNCPAAACNTTYKKVNSFCSHMYPQHRNIACTGSSTAPSSSHMQQEPSGVTDGGCVEMCEI